MDLFYFGSNLQHLNFHGSNEDIMDNGVNVVNILQITLKTDGELMKIKVWLMKINETYYHTTTCI